MSTKNQKKMIKKMIVFRWSYYRTILSCFLTHNTLVGGGDRPAIALGQPVFSKVRRRQFPQPAAS
jgi:hypothetical protein